MPPVPLALVAALSLPAGFAVAQLTGVRAAGGVVLLVAVAWCGLQWRRHAGTAAAAALVATYVGLFVASHLLARVTGAWPAVVLVALAMAAASLYATCFAPARR